MAGEMLHVFRNTPFGREILLQSLYFAKRAGYGVRVVLPNALSFALPLPSALVTVNLNHEFLRSPGTAAEHAKALAGEVGVPIELVRPPQGPGVLPTVPVDVELMCCPRSISTLASKIRLGRIGPGVRSIIRHAPFPVLLPAPCFKPWEHIVVLFGGSANSHRALAFGLALSRASGVALELITFVRPGEDRLSYERALSTLTLDGALAPGDLAWRFLDGHALEEALYEVPHDALVVGGAYGHGPVKDVLFGSMMETVQSNLPNSIVIVGHHYHPPVQP